MPARTVKPIVTSRTSPATATMRVWLAGDRSKVVEGRPPGSVTKRVAAGATYGRSCSRRLVPTQALTRTVVLLVDAGRAAGRRARSAAGCLVQVQSRSHLHAGQAPPCQAGVHQGVELGERLALGGRAGREVCSHWPQTALSARSVPGVSIRGRPVGPSTTVASSLRPQPQALRPPRPPCRAARRAPRAGAGTARRRAGRCGWCRRQRCRRAVPGIRAVSTASGVDGRRRRRRQRARAGGRVRDRRTGLGGQGDPPADVLRRAADRAGVDPVPVRVGRRVREQRVVDARVVGERLALLLPDRARWWCGRPATRSPRSSTTAIEDGQRQQPEQQAAAQRDRSAAHGVARRSSL